MGNYIRFDWAMKRLLRDKANHEVLEGFLESLLGEKFSIVRFLESEGNQQSDVDVSFTIFCTINSPASLPSAS